MRLSLSNGLRMVAVGRYMHHCPGCNKPHEFNVSSTDSPDGRRYAFNGDFERPTFSPDQRVQTERGTCRYFLTNGMLEFMGDCFHQYRNRTVPLPDVPIAVLPSGVLA